MRRLTIPILIAAVGTGIFFSATFYWKNLRGVLPAKNEPPKQEMVCKPTGCSGQICSDKDVITTCEYRAEYACYKGTKCERQASGECDWTQMAELQSCLKKY